MAIAAFIASRNYRFFRLIREPGEFREIAPSRSATLVSILCDSDLKSRFQPLRRMKPEPDQDGSYNSRGDFQSAEPATSMRTLRRGWPNRMRSRASRPARRACSSSYFTAESGTSTLATPPRIERMALSTLSDSGISASQASTKEPVPFRWRLASRRIDDTSPSMPRGSTRRTRYPRNRSRPAAATATSEPVSPMSMASGPAPEGEDGCSTADLDSRDFIGLRSPPSRLPDVSASDECHQAVHD